MKIRHPWLIGSLAWVGAQVIRLWLWTVRYQYRPLGPYVVPVGYKLPHRVIYAFWHENMLQMAYCYGQPDIWVLISKHADGQLIAEVAQRLGFSTVRGSSTRGGVEAVRQLLRHGREAHLVITPDGPRGPRRQVQLGLIYLAARTGLPIAPIAVGMDRPWRMNSWDRFAIPRPWSRSTCVTHDLVWVPAEATKEQLEQYRDRVEKALLELGAVADRWAETGVWPDYSANAAA